MALQPFTLGCVCISCFQIFLKRNNKIYNRYTNFVLTFYGTIIEIVAIMSIRSVSIIIGALLSFTALSQNNVCFINATYSPFDMYFSPGWQFALGDLNNDNREDFIVGSISNNSISIALSNTNNSYSLPIIFPTNCGSNQILADDMNNDGFVDIIITSSDSDFVKILTGNGTGLNFNSTNIFVGDGPIKTLLNDINNDGLLDIITSNLFSQSISIISNLGNNNYSLSATYTFTTFYDITSADFDNDGLIDVYAFSEMTSSNIFLKNNGNNNFSTINAPIYMGTNATDINSDGIQDIYGVISNSIVAFYGNNNFSFSGPVNINSGNYYNYLTHGDLNNDGSVDILSCHLSGSVSILINTGNGNFLAPIAYSLTPEAPWQTPNLIQPQFTLIKDLNNDGKSEIVVQKNNSGALNIFENCNTVFVDELSLFDNLKLHPNPSNGKFQINYFNNILNIKLTDIKGNEISINLKNGEFDISKYDAGIYFLTVSQFDGKSKFFRLIKTN